jgi:hypothetical protein
MARTRRQFKVVFFLASLDQPGHRGAAAVGAILFAKIAKIASDPSKKILKFNDLKIFYRPRNRPLEIKRRFSKSFCRRAPNRARHTGAGRCPATFVSILLNGGCGYEEPEPRPLLADKHRL